MYKKILLAYDGSESGQNALLDCHEIAQWSQAELTLIAVMPLPLSPINYVKNFGDRAAQAKANERPHARGDRASP